MARHEISGMEKGFLLTWRKAAGMMAGFWLLLARPASTLAADHLVRLFEDGKKQPAAFHLGIDYLPDNAFTVSAEGTRQRNGLGDMEAGLEWGGLRNFVPRFGYRPDAGLGKGVFTDLAAGMRMRFLGEQFVYAFAPFHEGGAAHYVSVTLKFR